MTKNLRAGFAAALAGAAIVAMAGCTSTGLPNALPSGTVGGTGGNPSQSGGSCPTATAGGTSVGNSAQGVYVGLTLPTGFDSAYSNEAGVTNRITEFADAAKTSNSSSANTWTQFKCLYAQAVAAWRLKTNRTD